jgi:hypothetical protein
MQTLTVSKVQKGEAADRGRKGQEEINEMEETKYVVLKVAADK